MNCEFEVIPCAISGNFICKRCTKCGHQLGLAATIAETRWDEIHAGIKANCPNRDAAAPQASSAPISAVTGPDFAAVSKNITAAVTGSPQGQPAPAPAQPPSDGTGPGSQLKRYLSSIGIKASPNCSCNARAQYMDFMGTVWCENNIDTIVGWLKEEAEKRKLPFLDWPARKLVKKAIAASKKAQAKQYEKQSGEENAVQSPTAG